MLQFQLQIVVNIVFDLILLQPKKKGASDQMIKEMIDVVGIANQNNKLVESYQVEVDKIYK